MAAVTYDVTWVKEDFIDFCLSKINPLLSYKKALASVTHITQLSDDMVEVQLKTNHHFREYQAGQFVLVSVEKNGVFHQRAYSLVGMPRKGSITIAVKKQGLVSHYIADEMRIGEVLRIEQPQGDFVLSQAPVDKPLLFIAAGSGITPIVGLVEQAVKERDIQVTLLYYSRDPAYESHFRKLAKTHTHFHFELVVDSAEKPARFSQQTLKELGVQPVQVHTFLCGAPTLAKSVNNLWEEQAALEYLTQERFVALTSDDNAESHQVTFRQKQRSFDAKGNLLVAAEDAGLNPSFGCRMGICNTCTCTKVSGTVRNTQNGSISSSPNEPIRLCISEALSPLEIDT